MATALEPVQSVQLACPKEQNADEEPVTFGLCETPITPPATPSCAASRSVPSLAITELLTGRLKAPTHNPLSRHQGTVKKEPVVPITSPAETTTITPSPTSLNGHPPEARLTSESVASNIHPSGDRTTSAQETGSGGPLQSEVGTSQQPTNQTKVQPVDASVAAPEPTTTTGDTESLAPASSNEQASSQQALPKVALKVAISSPDVSQRDKKLYVGKMKEVKCPANVQTQWMGKIRPRLINDLLPVLRTLPRSLPSEETIIEPELCMAGYATGKATEVELVPTVWIRCGGKKCRRVIQKAVDDLPYLHAFSRGKVEVRIRGPRPAASWIDALDDHPPVSRPQDRVEHGPIRLQVEVVDGGGSACGLRMRILDDEEFDIHNERVSTIGGLIKVDDKIYGLTTAHGIMGSLKGTSSDFSESEASDEDLDSDLDSGDDSDTSFDTGYLREHKVPKRGHSRDFHELGQVAKTRFQKETQELKWRDASSGPLSYCGQGGSSRSSSHGGSCIQDADFALVDMGFSSSFHLCNEYQPEGTGAKISVDGIKKEKDLDAGEVFLLAGKNQIIKGNLLPEATLFISRATVFNTRKIQLEEPLPTGTSGTWVVQGNLLCGIIIAVYDDDPYAHMITADKMFQDIHAIQAASFEHGKVSVATEEDIEGVYGKSANPDEGSVTFVNTNASVTNSQATRKDKPLDRAFTQPRLEGVQTVPIINQEALDVSHAGYWASENPRRPNPPSFNFNRTWEHVNVKWYERQPWTTIGWIIRAPGVLVGRVGFALLFVVQFVFSRLKRVIDRFLFLRHAPRYRKFFDSLIRIWVVGFFVLSGVTIGVAIHKLFTLLGKDDFFLIIPGFSIALLIFSWMLVRLITSVIDYYRRPRFRFNNSKWKLPVTRNKADSFEIIGSENSDTLYSYSAYPRAPTFELSSTARYEIPRPPGGVDEELDYYGHQREGRPLYRSDDLAPLIVPTI